MKPLLILLIAVLVTVAHGRPALAEPAVPAPALAAGALVGAAPQGMAKYIPMGRWAFSFVLPGLGHVLLGEIESGLHFMFGTMVAAGILGVLGVVIPLVMAIVGGTAAVGAIGLATGPLGFVLGILGGIGWSALDAYGIDAAQHGYSTVPQEHPLDGPLAIGGRAAGSALP